MNNVEAVACDMFSDFQEAIEERCEHIQVVFDPFHIRKNFSDKLISQIRKDEQRRLLLKGDKAGADMLKRTKYILTSSQKTLEKYDQEAAEGKIIKKKCSIFGGEDITRKGGKMEKYQQIIDNNILLFTADIIKKKLSAAYELKEEIAMTTEISDIMELCESTGNRHFKWFSNLLSNHFEGIIAHATYDISTGKVEGTNNLIKTIRRKAFGYNDDDYFFLKIMDASRRKSKAHSKSPRICA